MTTEAQVRQELGDAFQEAVTEHEDVMAECVSILRLYNLTPASLFYKYEAFLLSRPSGLRARLSVLTLETVRELKKEIQREQQAKAVAGVNGMSGSGEGAAKSGGMSVGVRKGKGNMADLGGLLDGLSTPVRASKSRLSNPSARLANTSNNLIVPSPARSSFTPSSNSYATPQRSTPIAASSSSYRSAPRLVPPSTGSHLETPQGKGSNGHSGPSSPVSGPESPAALTPQPAQPFCLRPQPSTLVETLNPHLPSFTGVSPPSKPRVTLSSSSDPKTYDYRYMFEKISQRSEALDDLIDEFAEGIKDAYGITELGDPHFVSEAPVYTVGRILSPPTDSAKATANSLYLESSRFIGAGKRVALRFAPPGSLKVRGGAPGTKGFGVFPGCLVCVKGRNGGGGVFVVDEVLMWPPPSALPQTPVDELINFQHGEKLAGSPLSMLIAAGPYTLDDDINYEPLEALVEVVLAERPDVLILLGPFVDSQHPLIATGAVLKIPVDMFKDEVSARLQRIVDISPGTVIIVVPSVRDMVSRHMAYPQAMLDKEALGLPKRVRLLPNPCTFSVNEIVISLSSVDILFHLRREEFFHRAEEAEPDPDLKGQEVRESMAQLVRHVLGQRTFYPIFPPPEGSAGEVNLDVTHYSLLKMDGPAPDVLILPSKLKHFSKIVDSTLVINPAYLSRAHSAGTFAKVFVHPTAREELENGMDVEVDGGMREHRIWERARSEIWRI